MEQTLQALAGILLKAVPSIVLLLVVHLYLKWMFFRPLRKVLAKRREATEGAQESANALMAKASEQSAAIEAQLRKTREEVYQEQEEARRRLISAQTARLDEARHGSRELIHQAKQQIEAEATAARRELAATAETLADQIARSLLERKAS